MQYFSLASWLLIIASFTCGGIVAAQLNDKPPRIYVIDYMKVEPGAEDDPEHRSQHVFASNRVPSPSSDPPWDPACRQGYSGAAVSPIRWGV